MGLEPTTLSHVHVPCALLCCTIDATTGLDIFSKHFLKTSLTWAVGTLTLSYGYWAEASLCHITTQVRSSVLPRPYRPLSLTCGRDISRYALRMSAQLINYYSQHAACKIIHTSACVVGNNQVVYINSPHGLHKVPKATSYSKLL